MVRTNIKWVTQVSKARPGPPTQTSTHGLEASEPEGIRPDQANAFAPSPSRDREVQHTHRGCLCPRTPKSIEFYRILQKAEPDHRPAAHLQKMKVVRTNIKWVARVLEASESEGIRPDQGNAFRTIPRPPPGCASHGPGRLCPRTPKNIEFYRIYKSRT
jgi:hypothetical protein